jgi:hypothetical protein
MELKQRFEEKFVVTPSCWTWTGGRTSKGYGRIRVGNLTTTAHRVSYKLYVADIPDGMIVCHRCDNPPCVNPDHLFVGTHGDNMKDKVQKGRLKKSFGARNGSTKLNEDQVRRIHSDHRLHREIAADYGVATSQVQRIKAGRYWSHLSESKG